jgi:hypothetical protein
MTFERRRHGRRDVVTAAGVRECWLGVHPALVAIVR